MTRTFRWELEALLGRIRDKAVDKRADAGFRLICTRITVTSAAPFLSAWKRSVDEAISEKVQR